MTDGYYGDFRAYLEELDKRGKLHRWRCPVNKDTELMPLMRLQYRGIADEKRQAFLFENVLDSRNRKHAIKVATGVYGSSREIVSPYSSALCGVMSRPVAAATKSSRSLSRSFASSESPRPKRNVPPSDPAQLLASGKVGE